MNLACAATEMAAPLSRGSKAGHSSDGGRGFFPGEVVRPQARETLDAGVRGAQLSDGRKAGEASFAAVQMKSKAGPAPPSLGSLQGQESEEADGEILRVLEKIGRGERI